MERQKHNHLNILYSSFIFLKLDPQFRKLMSNERITAKQEFENATASCQEKLFLRTYSLMGISHKAEILFWRISPDPEILHDTFTRILSAGIGKFLAPAHSFMGLFNVPDSMAKKELECGCVPKGMFGKLKFMLLHPLVRAHSWYELSETERQRLLDERDRTLLKHQNVLEHFFYSYGLDNQEIIVVRESDKLDELALASKELREQRIKAFTQRDYPALLCLGKDLRDILDAIG